MAEYYRVGISQTTEIYFSLFWILGSSCFLHRDTQLRMGVSSLAFCKMTLIQSGAIWPHDLITSQGLSSWFHHLGDKRSAYELEGTDLQTAAVNRRGTGEWVAAARFFIVEVPRLEFGCSPARLLFGSGSSTVFLVIQIWILSESFSNTPFICLCQPVGLCLSVMRSPSDAHLIIRQDVVLQRQALI